MALIIAKIIFNVLLVFNTYGRVCDGNGTDTSVDDVENIIRNLLEVEQGIVHVNIDGIVKSETSTNECITKFLASSINDADTDALEDDDEGEVEQNVSTDAITLHDNDDVNATPNDPTNERMTHMNIGYGEIQMIQHDREATQQRLIETLLYMYHNYTSSSSSDMTTRSGQPIMVECKMNHELCAYWAARGECEARPGTYRNMICKASTLCSKTVLYLSTHYIVGNAPPYRCCSLYESQLCTDLLFV
jgi:hypothetical protein